MHTHTAGAQPVLAHLPAVPFPPLPDPGHRLQAVSLITVTAKAAVRAQL